MRASAVRAKAAHAVGTLLLVLAQGAPARAAAEIIAIGDWESPPLEVRPLARWWWPGGSVDAAGLREHLAAIHAAGFGSVELQPLLLGLGDDDLAADPRLRSVGTPAFRNAVAEAAATAAELGLGFDLTLGSGWPGGLPDPDPRARSRLSFSGRSACGCASAAGWRAQRGRTRTGKPVSSIL